MAENKKGGGKAGAAIGGAAVVAVAAYLLGSGGFGLGGGSGLLPGSGQSPESAVTQTQETQQAQETQETEAQEAAQENEGVLTVTVREGGLTYNGAEVTLEELGEKLQQDYAEGTTTIEVRDDHAIKADYDAVIALLDGLGLPHTEG